MEWKKSNIGSINILLLPRGFVRCNTSHEKFFATRICSDLTVFTETIKDFVKTNFPFIIIASAIKILTTDGHRLTRINTNDLKISRINPCLSVSFICVYLWFPISGFFAGAIITMFSTKIFTFFSTGDLVQPSHPVSFTLRAILSGFFARPIKPLRTLLGGFSHGFF